MHIPDGPQDGQHQQSEQQQHHQPRQEQEQPSSTSTAAAATPAALREEASQPVPPPPSGLPMIHGHQLPGQDLRTQIWNLERRIHDLVEELVELRIRERLEALQLPETRKAETSVYASNGSNASSAPEESPQRYPSRVEEPVTTAPQQQTEYTAAQQGLFNFLNQYLPAKRLIENDPIALNIIKGMSDEAIAAVQSAIQSSPRQYFNSTIEQLRSKLQAIADKHPARQEAPRAPTEVAPQPIQEQLFQRLEQTAQQLQASAPQETLTDMELDHRCKKALQKFRVGGVETVANLYLKHRGTKPSAQKIHELALQTCGFKSGEEYSNLRIRLEQPF